MSKPTIAAKRPIVVELDAGTYWWCACGQSQNQPYCDGTHQGTDLKPLPVTLTEQKTVAFCLCKQTGNPPYCDGAHSKLS
ncbi:cytochrome C551 [Neosynechococcus sphagnicola sy1]|uniref:Cytochrome C551 n=1 Tax=Neosynechococcus sphagnicola sy1 TaxID=1497020 RepID=A0A098TMI2_9CYAN|nr:CDGSH iron-sulfur domain-containing protein [Neosynechococcus sphagnicola]KGF73514.1 cytochrome C551 [Neosynechococcus sphagnicola sy1]